MDELTDRQRVFVEEYLTCWNATEAARRAGYAHPRQQGSENLSKPDIRALIDARIAEKAMGANEVLARIAEHARADMREFLGEGEEGLIPLLKRDAPLHLLKKVSFTTTGTTFELVDAQAALQLLGKHYKLFVDRKEVAGENGGPLTVRVVYDDDTPGGEAPEAP